MPGSGEGEALWDVGGAVGAAAIAWGDAPKKRGLRPAGAGVRCERPSLGQFVVRHTYLRRV